MKTLLSTALLFFPLLMVFAQQNENAQHLTGPRLSRIGLLNVQFQNKAYQFETQDNMVGVTSHGLQVFKNSQARLIPFSVDIILNTNELKKAYQFDASIFASGFSDIVNNRFAHEVRFDLLNFDRERFRENGIPMIVDRFKLLDVRYTAMITIVPNIVKITFSGRIAPLQSTRQTTTPADIQQLMIDQTGHDDITFYSAAEDATTFKKVFGDGLKFQNDHQTTVELNKGISWSAVSAAGEAFLGDSEFGIGLMLFNFLEAKLSYAIDGVQTGIPAVYGNNYHEGFEIDLLSYKTTLSAEAKLERLVPAKNFFRHFVVFTELTKEKSDLSVGDLSLYNKDPSTYKTTQTRFTNRTITTGLRFTFLKPYKRAQPNANFTISRD